MNYIVISSHFQGDWDFMLIFVGLLSGRPIIRSHYEGCPEK